MAYLTKLNDYVRTTQTGYLAPRFRMLRSIVHSIGLGCLIWYLTGMQALACYGLIFVGFFEIYLAELQVDPRPNTFRSKLGRFPAFILPVLLLFLFPIPLGLYLPQSNEAGFEEAFSNLAVFKTVFELIVMGWAIGLMDWHTGYWKAVQQDRSWGRGVVAPAIMVLGLFPVIFFVAGGCLNFDKDCVNGSPMKSESYQLDGSNGPVGKSRLYYAFAKAAAQGDQGKYEKLNVLTDRSVLLFLIMFALVCLVALVSGVRYQLLGIRYQSLS